MGFSMSFQKSKFYNPFSLPPSLTKSLIIASLEIHLSRCGLNSYVSVERQCQTSEDIKQMSSLIFKFIEMEIILFGLKWLIESRCTWTWSFYFITFVYLGSRQYQAFGLWKPTQQRCATLSIVLVYFSSYLLLSPQNTIFSDLAKLIVYQKNGLDLFLKNLVPGLSCAVNEYLMFSLVYTLKNSSGIIDY